MNRARRAGPRRPPPVWAFLVPLLLPACAAIDGAAGVVRERWVPDPGASRILAAAPREARAALRAAALQLGYRLVRDAPAPGDLEGVGPVAGGAGAGSSRQVRFRARLRPLGDGTEVTVLFLEAVQGDASRGPAAPATEVPLRNSPRARSLLDLAARQLGSGEPGAVGPGAQKSR